MWQTNLISHWPLVQMVCLMCIPHGLLHGEHWPFCSCRCTVMSVCQLLCSHFGLVTIGSVMDVEVESFKAAI